MDVGIIANNGFLCGWWLAVHQSNVHPHNNPDVSSIFPVQQAGRWLELETV